VPIQARLDHLDKQVTHALRDDLDHLEVHNMPPFAQGNPAVFFTAAQSYERQRGQIAVEWKFSLPRELSHADQLAATRALLQSQFGDRHPYVFAIHGPQASDGGEQRHVHVLWSSRNRDDLGRSAEVYFKQPNQAHPDRGGPGKAKDKYAFGTVKSERVLYSDVMNYYLDISGSVARLHPEKVADRGLDRRPEPRVSIADSNAYKFDGKITDNWQKVLEHRQARAAHREEEQALAREYWAHRKAQLGITPHVSYELALERIAEARTRSLTTPPRQRGAYAIEQEMLGLQQSITALEQHRDKLTIALTVEQAYGRLGHPIPEHTVLKHDQLLSEGQAMGISRAPQPSRSLLADRALARERRAQRERPSPVLTKARDLLQGLSIEDESTGQGLQVRLRDSDRDREQDHDRSEGMGW
jgi:hypothetical protein